MKSSVFVHLNGRASQVTVELSNDSAQAQGMVDATGADSTILMGGSDDYSRHQPSLTVPAPLVHGAVIQLQAHLPNSHLTDVPHYAVAEDLLMSLLHRATDSESGPNLSQTLFDNTLSGVLMLEPHNSCRLACPAGAVESNQPQQQKQVEQVILENPTSSTPQQTVSAVVPWTISVCLLLYIIGLAVYNRCCSKLQSDSQPAQVAVSKAERSYVRSNQDLITPTKDAGCSPFVPVTQAPMQHLPYANGYLASCSSKIGSHRVPRPTTSKAITNMTSNVSGCTKWQRSKNGRLLSLAPDPNEHTS